MAISVLVLSGGRASRLGRDKASTPINGVTMMERVLRAIPQEAQVIVVGEYPEDSKREVIVTREEPTGAGPLAAMAAGLRYVTNSNFLLLATDMPFVGDLGVKLLEVLEAIPSEFEAVIPIDDEGQYQPLCAAYRTESVRRALERIGELTNGSMKRLLSELRYQRYDQQEAWVLSDVDTVANLDDARSRASAIEGETTMDEWIAEVKLALGLTVDVDVDLLLNLAREAAHNVTRPAAPITTYLLGIAVANGADAKTTAAKIERLAMARIKSEDA